MLGTTRVLAFRSIRRHVLRSFLTVLGIVIGVAAVVTMVTLGNATSAAVQQSIANLGTNILQIYPSAGLLRGGGGSRRPEGRRVGKGCVSTFRSSGATLHLTKRTM